MINSLSHLLSLDPEYCVAHPVQTYAVAIVCFAMVGVFYWWMFTHDWDLTGPRRPPRGKRVEPHREPPAGLDLIYIPPPPVANEDWYGDPPD